MQHFRENLSMFRHRGFGRPPDGKTKRNQKTSDLKEKQSCSPFPLIFTHNIVQNAPTKVSLCNFSTHHWLLHLIQSLIDILSHFMQCTCLLILYQMHLPDCLPWATVIFPFSRESHIHTSTLHLHARVSLPHFLFSKPLI